MLDGMEAGRMKGNGSWNRVIWKKPHAKAGKKQRYKKAKKRDGSGGNKKTHSEEVGFKKQDRGLGMLMEWASACAVQLFLDKREEA